MKLRDLAMSWILGRTSSDPAVNVLVTLLGLTFLLSFGPTVWPLVQEVSNEPATS